MALYNMLTGIIENINVKNWKLWFFIALLAKLLMAIAIIFLKTDGEFQLYFNGGDTINYIEPIENLIITGELYTHIGEDPFRLRMPGFLPLYYPLRMIFKPDISLAIIVLIQLILSALSCYLLALISTRLTHKNKNAVFLGTFSLFTLSTYASYFDIYILSES